ncbi:MAG: hypothetical protein ABSH48_05080 [Verrucomicrobiota bacterium]|jgi:hypothetical protein
MKLSPWLTMLMMARILVSAAEPPLLDAAQAGKFAQVALAGIDREYPNKPRLHTDAGLKHVFSGNYEGEPWLATFAVYDVGGGIAPPRSLTWRN